VDGAWARWAGQPVLCSARRFLRAEDEGRPCALPPPPQHHHHHQHRQHRRTAQRQHPPHRTPRASGRPRPLRVDAAAARPRNTPSHARFVAAGPWPPSDQQPPAPEALARLPILCTAPACRAAPMAYTSKYHDDSDEDYEASDEHERSVIQSPTLPVDYPESSPTSSGPMSTEHTPTTFTHSRDTKPSPTGLITEWTKEHVADFVARLGLTQYVDTFIGTPPASQSPPPPC
jgi:hypothetical protein